MLCFRLCVCGEGKIDIEKYYHLNIKLMCALYSIEGNGNKDQRKGCPQKYKIKENLIHLKQLEIEKKKGINFMLYQSISIQAKTLNTGIKHITLYHLSLKKTITG